MRDSKCDVGRAGGREDDEVWDEEDANGDRVSPRPEPDDVVADELFALDTGPGPEPELLPVAGVVAPVDPPRELPLVSRPRLLLDDEPKFDAEVVVEVDDAELDIGAEFRVRLLASLPRT